MLSLMNRHIEKEGAFYLLTLRMAHAPYSIVNPVSGASRVPMWTFVWTTAIGLLPGTAVWAYVGVRLPSLRDLANSGLAGKEIGEEVGNRRRRAIAESIRNQTPPK